MLYSVHGIWFCCVGIVWSMLSIYYITPERIVRWRNVKSLRHRCNKSFLLMTKIIEVVLKYFGASDLNHLGTTLVNMVHNF